MVPQCDLNPNPLFNYPFIADLVKGQLNVKVMPFPTSAVQPYMHSKMIMVDKKTFYVGSVNFSRSSTLFARELGIILTNDSVAAEILNYFELDWKTSVAPVPPAAGVCPQLN
jgi:phosphatidylserine/phosphatidylglycerophosphate/cardiolipin synthase-like enzyme